MGNRVRGLWCLTPLSAIFQLYHEKRNGNSSFQRQILDLYNRETTWINKSALQARWSVTMCLQRLDKWEFLLSNPTLSIRKILLFVNIILQIKILLILIYHLRTDNSSMTTKI
jgi:hypothetical protein